MCSASFFSFSSILLFHAIPSSPYLSEVMIDDYFSLYVCLLQVALFCGKCVWGLCPLHIICCIQISDAKFVILKMLIRRSVI